MTKRIYWGKIRGNLKGNLRGFLKEEEKCQEGKKQKTGFDFFALELNCHKEFQNLKED